MSVSFRLRWGRAFRALSDVRLRIAEGESLALAGESGSGKTTLARTILGLVGAERGRILFAGSEVRRLRGDAFRAFRRQVQMVFQDASGSLNPRLTVGELVAEPLRIHRLARGAVLRTRVERALDDAGLDAAFLPRYPRELSGGQRQRVGIARALVTEPRLLILDEPTSALDVSVQAEVLNLLRELREHRRLTCLLITHNLAIVPFLCDGVAVMERGCVVESGPAVEVLGSPRHPCTARLLASVLKVPERMNGPGVGSGTGWI